MTGAVRAAFLSQARACAELGSPFTAWLCERFAETLSADTRVGARVLGWRGDPSGAGDSVALRLCGALHALALSGTSKRLAAVYAAPERSEPAWTAVRTALERHGDFIEAFLTAPPQTNEVARAAVIYPALREIARRADLPLELLEVGASAGLNLNCDRFGYRLGGRALGDPASPLVLEPRWSGDELREGREPRIVARRGCDLRPFKLDEPAERMRLLAYVWPDQTDRLERVRAAIDIVARNPSRVDAEDALAWLERRLAEPQGDRARVVYSTIAWQYLPPDDRLEGERMMAAAGARAACPLCWLRFEADGARPGAAITLRTWPGGETEGLGRADFHGRWVDWVSPER